MKNLIKILFQKQKKIKDEDCQTDTSDLSYACKYLTEKLKGSMKKEKKKRKKK